MGFPLENHMHGHYEILGPLGEGGMGVVYKARDTRLGRLVAFKFLAAGLLGSYEARDRSLAEARAIAALNHPNIATIYENQLDILTARNIQGAPALVIEILSPSTPKRDQGIKRRLYERCGVRAYWVVDSATASVTISRRHPDGSFRTLSLLTASGRHILRTPLLPGWSLALARLFR